MRDEAQLIAGIRESFGAACADTFVDDGAALPEVAPDAVRVVTADVVVEDVHFSFALSPAESAGHRAVVQNVSDLAAMAATPVGFVWTLSIPPRLFDESGASAFLRAFIDGAASAAAAYEIPLFGGDLSSTSGPFVCAITAFGDAPHERPVRSGAKVGDRIFVGKKLGESAAGLRMLLADERAQPSSTAAIAAHEFPTAQVALGLAVRPVATSLMDISDGLALDLYRLVEASKCGAQLHPNWKDCFGARATHDDVLFGGEDYALLFTVDARCSTDDVRALAARVGEGGALYEIGCITAQGGAVIDAKGAVIPRRGYDHFRAR